MLRVVCRACCLQLPDQAHRPDQPRPARHAHRMQARRAGSPPAAVSRGADAGMVALTRATGIVIGVMASLLLSCIIFPKSASMSARAPAHSQPYVLVGWRVGGFGRCWVTPATVGCQCACTLPCWHESPRRSALQRRGLPGAAVRRARSCW